MNIFNRSPAAVAPRLMHLTLEAIRLQGVERIWEVALSAEIPKSEKSRDEASLATKRYISRKMSPYDRKYSGGGQFHFVVALLPLLQIYECCGSPRFSTNILSFCLWWGIGHLLLTVLLGKTRSFNKSKQRGADKKVLHKSTAHTLGCGRL